jgi:hypothetical protein
MFSPLMPRVEAWSLWFFVTYTVDQFIKLCFGIVVISEVGDHADASDAERKYRDDGDPHDDGRLLRQAAAARRARDVVALQLDDADDARIATERPQQRAAGVGVRAVQHHRALELAFARLRRIQPRLKRFRKSSWKTRKQTAYLNAGERFARDASRGARVSMRVHRVNAASDTLRSTNECDKQRTQSTINRKGRTAPTRSLRVRCQTAWRARSSL